MHDHGLPRDEKATVSNPNTTRPSSRHPQLLDTEKVYVLGMGKCSQHRITLS